VDAPTAEGARWTAVRLAYDDALAADVILPREGVGPDDLTADDLAEAREALDEAAPREVFVRMPTFDLTGKTDLLETLPQVDLRDLSGMGPGLTVDQWVQQARLRVTAKGTVGAAVTEVVVGESAVMPPPDQFVVDRPYVFRVLDTRTGWPLFLAAVSDPTEE
jgi:serine protease inhibitor